jgi:hypothetical protein
MEWRSQNRNKSSKTINKNKTKQNKEDWFYTSQPVRLDRNIAMRKDFTHNKEFDFVLGYEHDTYLLF